MVAATETEDLASVHIRCIPRKLQRRFKALCARRGRSLRDALCDLLTDAADDPGGLPEPYDGPRDGPVTTALHVRGVPRSLRRRAREACPKGGFERTLVAMIEEATRE